jgi:hypothetical protein
MSKTRRGSDVEDQPERERCRDRRHERKPGQVPQVRAPVLGYSHVTTFDNRHNLQRDCTLAAGVCRERWLAQIERPDGAAAP